VGSSPKALTAAEVRTSALVGRRTFAGAGALFVASSVYTCRSNSRDLYLLFRKEDLCGSTLCRLWRAAQDWMNFGDPLLEIIPVPPQSAGPWPSENHQTPESASRPPTARGDTSPMNPWRRTESRKNASSLPTGPRTPMPATGTR